MERHYILASHGMFSQGIYDSIRIILGEKKHVHLITAYVKDGQDISDLIKEENPDRCGNHCLYGSVRGKCKQ